MSDLPDEFSDFPVGEAEELQKVLEKDIGKIMKYAALKITQELVKATPVDTGFARASWIPSIGKPTDQVGGSPSTPSNNAQAQGQASILRYTVDQGDIYITNNVNYMEWLNLGHSEQAEHEFVEDAIARGTALTREKFGK